MQDDCFEPGLTLDEQLGYLQLVVEDGDVERRAARGVAVVHVHPALDQGLYHLAVAVPARVVQQRVLFVDHVRATWVLLQHGPHCLQVPPHHKHQHFSRLVFKLARASLRHRISKVYLFIKCLHFASH